MDGGYVDPAHRVLHWWNLSSLPRPASVNEYVPTPLCSLIMAHLSFRLVWPANLVNCALFNTLHQQVYSGIGNRGGITRERFFFYGFCASAVWYFFPGYLFEALSVFSWVCWIAPNNVVSQPNRL